MSLPAKLKNMNLFNEGRSYMGQVDEVVLPVITAKMEEWRGGGMDIPVDIDLGMEKLSMEWTAGGWLADALKQFGVLTVNGVGLRFTGAVQSDDTEEVKAVEVVVRGRHSEMDMGNAKPGEDTAHKFITSLSYYKLTYDGEELIEVDALNMVKKIGGKDLMADFRSALGI